jgi:two-component system, cell cycle sensor histidine kinase and response regulator CckA
VPWSTHGQVTRASGRSRRQAHSQDRGTGNFPRRPSLGLSAVSGIVRAHKGALQVTSSPGQGTTFQIFFPGAAEARKDEGRPSLVETNVSGGASVLIVDDEAVVRNLAQASLQRYGYTALLAENAQSAMELLERADLIVLDLSMPGMTAEEAIEAFQCAPPQIGILLSSGYGEEEMLNRFAASHLVGFLGKPYTPFQLVEKIAAALKRGTSSPLMSVVPPTHTERLPGGQPLPLRLRS